VLTLAGRFLLKISNISPFIFNTLQFSSVFVTLAVGILGLKSINFVTFADHFFGSSPLKILLE